MDFLSALLAFGVVLVPLIIIHEFGHLLACKSVGIAVLEFGLGFPPRVAKLFRWGETDFTLNWIPLGGFVMPYGEDFLKPLTEDELEKVKLKHEDTFTEGRLKNAKSVFQAKPWQKIWFLFAGPLANLITAVVLFIVLGLTGVLSSRAEVTVTEVIDETPAAEAGLQVGDIILSVDGKTFDESTNDEILFDIRPDFEDAIAGKTNPVTLRIQRGDETLDLVVNPASIIPENVPVVRIGIGAIQEDSPAQVAGFEPDDVILAANGESVDNIDRLREITNASEGEPMLVTILRAGEALDIEVTPERLEGEDRARIGIVLEELVVAQPFGFTVDDRNFERYTRRYSVIGSLEYGIENFVFAMNEISKMPSMIINGEISAEEARPVSVVGVSQIGGQIIQENPYQDVIIFIALISIALAITNLLPIPGLDGGRILFVLIEIVRGKPMSPEREGIVHMIGIGLLLSLMVVLVINDIINPLQLPQ